MERGAVDMQGKMTEEMIIFRQLLEKHGIEYEDQSEPESYIPIYRTHFDYRGYHWSVIHGYGTYGGFSCFESDKGLLEVRSGAIDDGNPIGYLTAQEVMRYVLGEVVV